MDPTAVAASVWPSTITLAEEHGLAPTLYWVIRQSGLALDPSWPSPVNSLQNAAVRSRILEKVQRQANDALAAAHIPAIWLKGIILATSVYPQPYLRPMEDLDVLIRESNRQEAWSVLNATGFYPPNDSDNLEITLPANLQHHDRLVERVSGVPLELHFRLLGSSGYRLLPPTQLLWFFGQTQTVTSHNGSYSSFTPEAQLLYLCAHTILQHGEAELYLRRYFDLHLLVSRLRLDWPVVIDQAVDLRWTYAVGRALTLTQQYFGTPLPDGVLDELQRRRTRSEYTSRLTGSKSRFLRWEQMLNLLSELTLPQKLHIIRQVAVPPSAYMRKRYAIEAGRPVWPYYFYRWYDQGQEVIRSILHR